MCIVNVHGNACRRYLKQANIALHYFLMYNSTTISIIQAPRLTHIIKSRPHLTPITEFKQKTRLAELYPSFAQRLTLC